MKCYLINAGKQVIYSFEAVDMPAARRELVAKCMGDRTSYELAIVARLGIFSEPAPVPAVEDAPA